MVSYKWKKAVIFPETGIFLFMLLFFTMTVNSYSQNMPGFFGKRNLLTTETMLYYNFLIPKSGKIVNSSIPVPGIKVEIPLTRYTFIGFAYRHNSYDFRGRSGRFSYTTYEFKYNDQTLNAVLGEGTLHMRSNAFIANIKKYARPRSMPPFGLFSDFCFGYIGNRIIVDRDYKLYDVNNTEFRLAEEDRFPMSQIVFGYNLGKVVPLYKDLLMLDWSFGIGFRIRTTGYRNAIYERWAERANRLILGNHLFSLKTGLAYAF